MKTLLIAAMIAGSAALAMPAHASLSMSIDGTVVNDNGPNDQSPQLNMITAFGFNGTIGTSGTGLAVLDPLAIDLGTSSYAVSAGTTVIKLTETGLTNPAQVATFRTQFSGNYTVGSGIVTAQSYIDAGNVAFGTGTPLSTLSSSSTPFALVDYQTAGGTTPFSLTEVITINAATAGTLSLDTSVSAVDAVPEPASMALLGTGLLGAGMIRLRRRAATA